MARAQIKFENRNNTITPWKCYINSAGDVLVESLPLEVERAYQELWTDSLCSSCCIVEDYGELYVALSNDFDDDTAIIHQMSMDELYRVVENQAKQFANEELFDDTIVISGEHTGYDGSHELIVLIPCGIAKKRFNKIAAYVDKNVYRFSDDTTDTNIKPGEEVWVIERDEYGEPCAVVGCMFIAEAAGYIITSAFVNETRDVEETMAYHAIETRKGWDTDLAVYPSTDCFTTKEGARKVLENLSAE